MVNDLKLPKYEEKKTCTQTHLQCRFDSAVSGLSMNSFFASQVECKSDAPYLKEKTLNYY